MAKLPHRRKWRKTLSALYDEQSAAQVLSRAQTLYDDYVQQHPMPESRADRVMLRTRVLPGLALYKALLEVNPDRDKVLAEMDTLFRTAFFTTMLRGIRVVNLLPDPFVVIRPALRMMTRPAMQPGVQELVEDSQDCFAVNTYRCFILDTLIQHNAADLAPLYCATDAWLTEAIPAIRFERTKTLAEGGDCCDFRWCRVGPKTKL